MSDVFLSYAREDQATAEALANALQAQGLSVWWDRHIVPGHSFDDVIERELDQAGHVVVLWTPASVGSEWVRSEAATGAERGVLIPVSVDGQRPPLAFRRKQTLTLTGWDGDPGHAALVPLLRAIRPSHGSSAAPAASRTGPAGAVRRPLLIGSIVALLALALGLATIRPGAPDSPAPTPPPPDAQAAKPPAPPVYRWQLVASNIDDDVHVEINAIERFSRSGGQATFDLTPYLTGGDDRVNVRLGNGNCLGSSLNVQFLRDGKPYGGTARHHVGLSHCGWQFDWEWTVNRSSGAMRRVR